MTPLRQRMITAMQMHGYSPQTHQSYLAAVRGLAKHTHRSPDSLSQSDGTAAGGQAEPLVSQLWQANFKIFTNFLRHKIFDLTMARHCCHFPITCVLPN